MSLTIEVVCYNITSVLNAIEGGASRIELCDSPGDGGTTPSAGMILTAKEKARIPVFVMIRPRGGDFLYSDEEFEVMKKDIESAKKLGADGLVFGILKANGEIDTERNRELVQLARPLKVTCHRAFDMTNDPHEALEACIEAGFDRILTSGQQANVYDGRLLLAELVKKAGDRIIIMPGAGVSEENVADLVKTTGAKEIHISGRSFVDSPMAYRNPAVSMGDDPREYQKLVVSVARVKKIRFLAEGVKK
ncbi:copper homeostasis protein CutC [uncultured Imperialibacter sp.]|uniref:copper homeostasis protein CutC n=1 Tax=uncultured Imperialibacter sp. TaxID=1672639 RepID=UPI0030DB12DB|tara:strand:- start:41091 stop:41837 length:747 start_codon:yes stop_codon:yes gene_type:complete